MKKLFVFLIAVLTLALMGCGGDAPKKDAAAPAAGDKQVLNLFSWADNFDPEVIAEFEKDGLSKYKPKYILTFLEHIANAYQNNRILLNDGRSAKIILLNSKHLSAPMIQLDDGTCLDLDREPALYIKSVV